MLTRIDNCIRGLTDSIRHKYKSSDLYKMSEDKSKAIVEEKADDEDKNEVLGNLVKVVVLIWSASLLTFSHVRLPNGQKILDFDPTFIASVFSGSLLRSDSLLPEMDLLPRKHHPLAKRRMIMQKLINVVALLSGLVSLSVVGGGAYLYLNKDVLIERARKNATEL